MRLTTFRTKSTCIYVQYVQIRANTSQHKYNIRAYTYFIFAQIRANTADRMCTYMQVYASICMYVARIRMCTYVKCTYMQVWASMCMYATIFFASMYWGAGHWYWHKKGFFYFSGFNCLRLVVDRPNHGPGVDVEQGAASARLARPVAHAQWVACFLASMHVTGNGASITRWNKGQLPQNVWQWNNIHNRLRGREVQQLGSNLSSAGPPRFRLGWAKIVHGFYEWTLALHHTTSISADSHLKDEVDASIPTLIDRRAEIGCFAAIVGRGGINMT